MEFIDTYYTNLNIYYGLIIYNNKPHDLIKSMLVNDYPVTILENISQIEDLEINNRIFAIHEDSLRELIFVKDNNMRQFSIVFCLDDTFENVINIYEEKKPICEENIIITKIF
jgi:hypothetical protein